MASKVFISQIAQMMNSFLVAGAADIRGKLCMSNSTCAANALTDITAVSGITTLDLSDATSYADNALTTPAVEVDDPNNRGEFFDDGSLNIAFVGLGGDATRDYIGVLLYKYIDGTDANDIPVAWIEFGSAVAKESTSVTVTWNAEGIMQGRNAA